MKKALAVLLETGLFLLVAVLGIWVNRWFWVAAIPALFSRSLLREFGLLDDLDERERLTGYRASHLAYILTLTLLTFFILVSPQITADRTNQEIFILLVIPLLIRLAFQLGFTYSLRKSGLLLGFVIGGGWFLFALISHGLTAEGVIESLIGLAILLPTFLALRIPRLGGALLLVAGLAGTWFVAQAHYQPSVLLIMTCLVPLPLLLAGIFLLMYRQEEENEPVVAP